MTASVAVLSLCPAPGYTQTLQIGVTGTNNGGVGTTSFSSIANQFGVGGNSFTLSFVTALIRGGGATTSTARIYSDNNNRVGSLLATASASAPANTITANTVFNFAGGTTLTANTKFWLYISANGSTSWRYTDSGTQSGANGTVNDLYALSSDNGATFSTPDDNATPGLDPQLFSISGVAVSAAPEMPTAGLFTLGLVPVIGLISRRRR